MKIQISSGDGPVECEIAVSKFLESLRKEFPSIVVIKSSPGRVKDSLKSALISSEEDLSSLEGTILWISQSPVRANHKRKNWYVDVSVAKELSDKKGFDLKDVEFQTFLSGGKGGQNVNKTETGVRAIHRPTGASVVSTEERSQKRNKDIAVKRLRENLEKERREEKQKIISENRLEHTKIERGNPLRTYVGEDFKRRD
jgi:peptide chain release factor